LPLRIFELMTLMCRTVSREDDRFRSGRSAGPRAHRVPLKDLS
jgi:hypothetical protein